jgi:hypothetical protein
LRNPNVSIHLSWSAWDSSKLPFGVECSGRSVGIGFHLILLFQSSITVLNWLGFSIQTPFLCLGMEPICINSGKGDLRISIATEDFQQICCAIDFYIRCLYTFILNFYISCSFLLCGVTDDSSVFWLVSAYIVLLLGFPHHQFSTLFVCNFLCQCCCLLWSI